MSTRRKRRTPRVRPIPKRLRDHPDLNRRPVPLIGPPWRRLLCWLGLAHRDFLLWHTGAEVWEGTQTGKWPASTVFCGWCGRRKPLGSSPVSVDPSRRSLKATK
jgi:hypothetical protein